MYKILDLEGCKPAVDRDRAAAEPPDGDKLGKKFQTVAESQKNPVIRRQPVLLEPGDTAGHLPPDFSLVPPSAAYRFNKISYAEIK